MRLEHSKLQYFTSIVHLVCVHAYFGNFATSLFIISPSLIITFGCDDCETALTAEDTKDVPMLTASERKFIFNNNYYFIYINFG